MTIVIHERNIKGSWRRPAAAAISRHLLFRSIGKQVSFSQKWSVEEMSTSLRRITNVLFEKHHRTVGRNAENGKLLIQYYYICRRKTAWRAFFVSLHWSSTTILICYIWSFATVILLGCHSLSAVFEINFSSSQSVPSHLSVQRKFW